MRYLVDFWKELLSAKATNPVGRGADTGQTLWDFTSLSLFGTMQAPCLAGRGSQLQTQSFSSGAADAACWGKQSQTRQGRRRSVQVVIVAILSRRNLSSPCRGQQPLLPCL